MIIIIIIIAIIIIVIVCQQQEHTYFKAYTTITRKQNKRKGANKSTIWCVCVDVFVEM